MNPQPPAAAELGEMLANEERLRQLLAKATSSCPEVIEFGSETRRYWLNGVTNARIEIVNALPALLATIAALRAEVEEGRKVLEPFARVALTSPQDATDNDFAAVRFRDIRAARAFLAKADHA